MPEGGLARIRGGGGVTPLSGQSEGGHEEIGVQEGGLSDCTILFYFKEMCSLLSAVLKLMVLDFELLKA